MPELTVEQLAKAIDDGGVTLLTIDTNIFSRYNNGLEYGLLKRLSQFRDSEIKLVLSDVVHREVRSHMIQRAEEAEARLTSVLKDVGGSWNIAKEERDKLQAGLLGGKSAVEVTQERLDAFQKETELEIIKAQGNVEIGDLVDDYFELRSPFGNRPDKKHEFPDAIALKSLDRYAAEKNTLMLAVSNDGGWRDFSVGSGNLVCVPDLGTAMSYLQRLPFLIAAKFSHKFEAGELPQLEQAIKAELGTYIDSMDLHVEASAAYFYEPDLPEKTFLDIARFNEPNFIVVDHSEEDGVYVLESSLVASVEVSCSFTFFITDWVDKDEVPIGSLLAAQTEEMPFVLTVTIVGDPFGEFEVEDIEVVQSKSTVDFGYIEPDYSGLEE
ncbi:MAG: hypothetical protein E5X74_32450 [Mesorhizobium sp.]|uniref:PIN domain-containing protein n=1 Tax=Mesorhizobium sp. TaxID=1871066 RepID=UPI001208AE1A|nr:PIN domain-containing protein [Mesorhizobium sp.]TIO74854.1 MAG: hypothetical protein E5X75_22270 [Mesorhizobium sp.]TIO80553.1 MAG: hypothetical protein E5X74_32450 [Mesorhizobium sp.]